MSDSSEAPRRALLSRVPWFAIALTLLIAAGAAFPRAAIHDGVTGNVVAEATLGFSGGYLALAPVWDVMDQLTLLTIPQHIALLVTLIIVFALWRAWRVRSGRAVAPAWRAWLSAVVALLAFYAIGAVVRRPMAQLQHTNPEFLTVDFHAHTKASHDGRIGWSSEDVRDWHDGAGFDAVYITDHRSIAGAQDGARNDPRQSGEATVVLPGIEVVWNGSHVNVLSAESRYRGIITPTMADVDPQALALASLVQGGEPIVIQTIPDNLDKMPPIATAPGTAGIRAIELIDGAPRGLAQSRRDRARIIHLADSLDLALVVGTDNHGWGRTAPGWTLMGIDGWRGMSPDSLAQQIENSIRFGRRVSTRVIERTATPCANALDIVFTGPLFAWTTVTTLDSARRTSWILWIWVIVIATWAVRYARRA